MKKAIYTLTAIICMMFSGNLSAQHAEAHKLDKQIELQLDSATHSMMMFILKQDTTYYVDAIMRADKSKNLVKQYKDLAAKEKGLAGRADADEVALYVEEINLLKKQTIKATVLGDKKQTEKYKYKGETYSVGTKSKTLLDQFSENL